MSYLPTEVGKVLKRETETLKQMMLDYSTTETVMLSQNVSFASLAQQRVSYLPTEVGKVLKRETETLKQMMLDYSTTETVMLSQNVSSRRWLRECPTCQKKSGKS